MVDLVDTKTLVIMTMITNVISSQRHNIDNDNHNSRCHEIDGDDGIMTIITISIPRLRHDVDDDNDGDNQKRTPTATTSHHHHPAHEET